MKLGVYQMTIADVNGFSLTFKTCKPEEDSLAYACRGFLVSYEILD